MICRYKPCVHFNTILNFWFIIKTSSKVLPVWNFDIIISLWSWGLIYVLIVKYRFYAYVVLLNTYDITCKIFRLHSINLGWVLKKRSVRFFVNILGRISAKQSLRSKFLAIPETFHCHIKPRTLRKSSLV